MSEDIFEDELSQTVTTEAPVEKKIIAKQEEVVETKEIATKEEQDNNDDESEIKDLLKLVIEDNSYRQKAKNIMERVDRKLGVWTLEAPQNFAQGNLLEEIIHYMRWTPDFLFECPLEILHQYEMVLASHITYVKARENHWDSMVKIANRDLKRGRKLAASYCSGKSIGEREAIAMTKYTQLADIEKELDMYNIYKDKCSGISDTFTQMDNSLKKTLERRKFEHEYNYKKENSNK
jgi:hypothetical protein